MARVAEELTGTPAAEGAPNTDSGSQATDPGTSAAPAGKTEGQFVDITDPDRYRYNGRSVKDWDSGFMRHQDYTSKTQAIAQERKYFDNLTIDLERVKHNPQLAEQFRQIYPEKYHAYLRFVASETPGQPQGQRPTNQSQYAQLDPRFVAEFNQMRDGARQREVQAITSELDHVYKQMAVKYPFADEEAVTARAQALFGKLKEQDPGNPNIRISDKQWDALWKSQNDRAQGLAETQYKTKVKAQLEASKRAGGAGSGGGIAGQAPRQFKNIKEASEAMRSDIESGVI